MSMLEEKLLGIHTSDEHLMWQIAGLHLARPQGLWASMRYPVQSDMQLGPARPRHRVHFEDDEHTATFSAFCISGLPSCSCHEARQV